GLGLDPPTSTSQSLPKGRAQQVGIDIERVLIEPRIEQSADAIAVVAHDLEPFERARVEPALVQLGRNARASRGTPGQDDRVASDAADAVGQDALAVACLDAVDIQRRQATSRRIDLVVEHGPDFARRGGIDDWEST